MMTSYKDSCGRPRSADDIETINRLRSENRYLAAAVDNANKETFVMWQQKERLRKALILFRRSWLGIFHRTSTLDESDRALSVENAHAFAELDRRMSAIDIASKHGISPGS